MVPCAVLSLLAACTEPSLEPVEIPMEGDDHGGGSVGLWINRDVDILFVIDDSSSMAEEQRALVSAFGSLLEVLERPALAANYRIGITTTDNGNPWCPDTTPEAGALQLRSCRSHLEDFAAPEGGTVDPALHSCTELCPEAWADIETQPTALAVGDEPRPRDWIERNEGITNLPEGLGTLQALQCLVPQGTAGCGFEAPLEAMWKAVRRTQTEDDPAYGFIRPESIFSVVHVTDEMDCSYNDDWESIFLPEGDRVFWADPEAAAPTSAVCWNAGVVCEGESPYEDCRPLNLDVNGNEVDAHYAEAHAVLRPVSRYVDMLADLENAKQSITPDQEVLVSVIGGVGADGSVAFQDAVDPTLQQDFGIGPGCEGSMGGAIPPVRLRELAEAFEVGDDRNMFSICDDDYAPALTAIGEAIAEQIRPSCMPFCVEDSDPSTDVLDPSCRFTQESPNPDGSFEENDIPPCEPGEAVPDGDDVCFVTLVGDDLSDFCAEVGFNLELRFVRRPGVLVPGGTAIVGMCTISRDKRSDCPDLP